MKRFFLLFISIVIICTSCIDDLFTSSGEGTLSIYLHVGSETSRFSTISPYLDIDRYIIDFQLYNGELTEKEKVILTENSGELVLAAGTWDIIVYAEDTDGVTLAELLIQNIEIAKNVENTIKAVLLPVSGTGNLNIALDLSSKPDYATVESVQYNLKKGVSGYVVEIKSGMLPEPYILEILELESGADYRLIFTITTNSDTILTEGVVHIFSDVTTADTVYISANDFGVTEDAIISDHEYGTLSALKSIPISAIETAKETLKIAYWHSSHGGQITSGMDELDSFMGGSGLYDYNNSGLDGALKLDCPEWADIGAGNYISPFDSVTRNYLDDSSNSDINVVIWSWCGDVTSWLEEQIYNDYLVPMNQLELDYPDIVFVYMTGHLDGNGLLGNLHLRNNQIRDYCIENNKILYDFEDIESYNPDGEYYGDRHPTDACNYDYNNSGWTTQDQTVDPFLPTDGDRNWAIDWQDNHTMGIDWYGCDSPHSQALNANQKAYAAWWLWAILAGWDGE